MNGKHVVATVIAVLIIAVLAGGLVAAENVTARKQWHDPKWYKYCEEPYHRAVHGHPPPPLTGQPCVPSVPGEPPPI